MASSVSSRSSSLHPTRQQLDELDALLQRMLEIPVTAPEEAEGESAAKPAPEPRKQSAPHRDEEIAQPRRPARPKREDAKMPVPESKTIVSPAMDAEPAAEPEVAENEKKADGWVPLRANWQPSAQTWGPLAQKWQEARQETTGPRPQEREPAAEDEPSEMPMVRQIPGIDPGSPDWWRSQPDNEPASTESADAHDPHPVLPTSWQVDAHPASKRADAVAAVKPLIAPSRSSATTDAPLATDDPPVPLLLWPLAAVDLAYNSCASVLGPLGRPVRSQPFKAFLGMVGLVCVAVAAGLWTADYFGWTP